MLKYPGKEIPGFHFTGREITHSSDFSPTEKRNVQLNRFNILGYYPTFHMSAFHKITQRWNFHFHLYVYGFRGSVTFVYPLGLNTHSKEVATFVLTASSGCGLLSNPLIATISQDLPAIQSF